MRAKSWRRITAEEREKEVNERTNRGLTYLDTTIPLYKPQVDKVNYVRLIPPLEGDELVQAYGLNVNQLYFGEYFLSPRSFDPQAEDPLDDVRQQFRREDPESRLIAFSQRTLCLVLDYADEQRPVLSVWNCPKNSFDELLSLARDRRSGELVALDDPENGRIVSFDYKSKKAGRPYPMNWAVEPEAVPLPDSLDIEDIFYWHDVVEIPSQEALQAAADQALEKWAKGIREPEERKRDKEEVEYKPRSRGDREGRVERGEVEEPRELETVEQGGNVYEGEVEREEPKKADVVEYPETTRTKPESKTNERLEALRKSMAARMGAVKKA